MNLCTIYLLIVFCLLFIIVINMHLIPITSMQTVRLKIQQLTLSASTVSHTAVTAFYPTIMLMITTAILLRLSKTANS